MPLLSRRWGPFLGDGEYFAQKRMIEMLVLKRCGMREKAWVVPALLEGWGHGIPNVCLYGLDVRVGYPCDAGTFSNVLSVGG